MHPIMGDSGSQAAEEAGYSMHDNAVIAASLNCQGHLVRGQKEMPASAGSDRRGVGQPGSISRIYSVRLWWATT